MKLPRIPDLILFEDDNLIILNKPTLITSEHESDPELKSLNDLLKRYNPEARLCHRLDRETSGAIIAAKSDEYYRYISIKFQKREIKKEYHALIPGVNSFTDRLIELPISKQGTYKAVIDKKEGKKATTVVNTLEVFKHYTLIKAEPVTGRFHQIRVHLASIGSPLVGDALYGGKPFFLSEIKKKKFNLKKWEEEQPVLNRAALHSFAVGFEYEGKDLYISAPYPKDIDTTIKLLRKYDSLPE
jgi:23S rRNA pseudouridine955/2504/2580 synthase